MTPIATTSGAATDTVRPSGQQAARCKTVVLLTFLAVAGVILLRHFMFGADYVGLDNDDTMRLVQVRDLLAGQAWFDTTQLRLGLEGGTVMHWSRLVDLPIANLVAFFSAFADRETAEAIALTVWPLVTMLVLLAAIARVAAILGDEHCVFAAMLLTGIFAATSHRFAPGAIDHHNVQLALLAVGLIGLARPACPRSAGLSGAGLALAIAIGAETVPIVAAMCGAYALIWLRHGSEMRQGAVTFALSLSLTLTAAFYATVAPADYGRVVCDGFSTGFYAIGVFGGGTLFALAVTLSGRSFTARLVGCGCAALAIAAAILLVAPQCVADPLAGLDPMLRTMWLDHVGEAQSIAAMWSTSPAMIAGHYLVPIIALAIALRAAWRDDARQFHLVSALLVAAALAIALVQVRGAVFAALFAIPVLALVAGRARARLRASPRSLRAAAAFCLSIVLAAPASWALAGNLIGSSLRGKSISGPATADSAKGCRSQAQMAALADAPTGVVSAVSNIGDDILRHTEHRVLSAPYHRNQAGMLTQLHIATEGPQTAQAFLNGAGVTLVVFCPGDPETRQIIRAAPDGLYASLARGDVPDYLAPVPGGNGAMTIYRVR
ncbi:hypothetical protein [Pararhizobium haloflavum]|uniref:hypothetical protein n=1 Tax=Pararhizobium haloflavum TaxID=2037914 RepID=UPI000C17FE65|nr:hypothetical protein [Pararhizobium haloflavum]